MTKLNAKDALTRVQPDPIIMTSFKNELKLYNVIRSLARVSNNIIKVIFDYVLKIMKIESHGTLKGSPMFLRLKGILWYVKVPQGQINVILC